MRKIAVFVLSVALTIPALAQNYRASEDPYKVPPKRYIHIGYVLNQEVEFQDPDLRDYGGKPEWSASFEAGTTYFINRLPWADMLRLGIDFSYLDLQYARYRNRIGNTQEQIDSHFGMIGMQVGPSLTVSPTRHVNLKAYIRYAPTFTAFASEGWKNVVGGYAGYAVGGASASWRMITLGWEARTNAGKANLLDIETDGDQIFQSGSPFGGKQQIKAPSMRLYVGFRF